MENDIACSGCVSQGRAEKNATQLAAHPCHFDNVAQSERCPYTWFTDGRFGGNCRRHALLKFVSSHGIGAAGLNEVRKFFEIFLRSR